MTAKEIFTELKAMGNESTKRMYIKITA